MLHINHSITFCEFCHNRGVAELINECIEGTKESDIAAYNINPSAKNTVLLWKGMAVKSNFVDVDTKKVEDIKKAVDAMLK